MAEPVNQDPAQQELEKSHYVRKNVLKEKLAEPKAAFKIGAEVSMTVRTDKGKRAKDFKVADRKLSNDKWVYSLRTKDDKPHEPGAWFAEADLSYSR